MDQQTLATAGIVAIFVLLFGGTTWFVIWQKRRIRKSFTDFSQAHGLELQMSSFPTSFGEVDGRFFSMGAKVHRTPTGRPQLQQVPDFTIQAEIKGAVPAGLVAGKRGALQGAGPVQVGDAEFDKKIWVDCPDIGAAKAYLTAERRQAMYKVAELGAVVVGPNDNNEAMVALQRRGYTPKQAWLEQRFQEFTGVAQQLDA